MASLQDQLLGMGLTDEKTAKKNKKQKAKQEKMQRKNQIQVTDETAIAAKQAREEKAQKDRELNAQRKAEAEKKAIVAQIKQLIQSNRVDRKDCEVAYNFTDGMAVKKINVNDEIQRLLGIGRLAIVKVDDRYDVVPFPVAEKIASRDDSFVVVLNEKTAEAVDEDDPYAEFQIPDDLMW